MGDNTLGIHVEGACIDTGQTVDVAQDKADTKPVRIQGEHIVLATGSVELGLPFGGREFHRRRRAGVGRIGA